MKAFIFCIIFISSVFGANENIAALEDIKKVVQKEEYIALAINKYIQDKASIPKSIEADEDGIIRLDWNKLTVDDYLGSGFNINNSYTDSDIYVYFKNGGNYAYIKGAITSINSYDANEKFIYNYYINPIYRVNTIPPKSSSSTDLEVGSFVKLGTLQKEIIKHLDEIDTTDTCTAGNKFYELENGKLISRYCKSTGTAIDIFQTEDNFTVDAVEDLSLIQAPIGTIALVNDGSDNWSEYYFQATLDEKKDNLLNQWGRKSLISGNNGDSTSGDGLGEGFVGSVDDSPKILAIRSNVGCSLVGGDISCWGRNNNNMLGIDSDTLLDSTASADYINTPVMLKTTLSTDIASSLQAQNTEESTTILGLLDNLLGGTLSSLFGGSSSTTLDDWDNSPFRIKYKNLSIDNVNVCAISVSDDLYCTGSLDGGSVNILTKVRSDIKDVALVDGTNLILDTNGDLYVKGSNDKGALGIGNELESVQLATYTKITSLYKFKSIHALRNTKTFGAIDENDNFWIWGQRDSENIYEPTVVSSSVKFTDVIVNPSEFILKESDDSFYKTYDVSSIQNLSLDPAIKNIGIVKNESTDETLYVDTDAKLNSSSTFLSCKNADGTDCSSTDTTLFNKSFDELKDFNNVAIFETGTSSSSSSTSEVELGGDDFSIDGEDWYRITYGTCYIEKNDSNVPNYVRCGKNSSWDDNIAMAKTYDFGSTNKNKDVVIKIRMYEIDSWDANMYYGDGDITDRFYVKVNDSTKLEETLANDSDYPSYNEYAGQTLSANLYDTQSSFIDELHEFEVSAQTDSDGKLKLELGAYLGQNIYDESFGIDSVKIYTVSNTSTSSSVSSTSSEYIIDAVLEEWSGTGTISNPTNSISYGDDTIYINGNLNNEYDLRSGDDTIYINGSLNDRLQLGEGNDLLEIAVNSNGRIKAEEGNDKIRINNDANNGIELGEGNDILVVQGNLNGNNLGDDTLYGDKGDDFVIIKSDVNIDIDLEEDNDTIQVFGDLNASLKTGSGNDRAYISGNINDNIDLGSGDDFIQVNKNVWHEIDGGSGTNSIYLKYYSKADYLSNSSLQSKIKDFDNILFKDGTYIGDNSVFISNGSGSGTDNTSTDNSKFFCTTIGQKSKSQLYCWGHVGNSLPLLSTSLYDDSKISILNSYFYKSSSEVNTSQSYDNFDNNGSLFLKYPTYIGGFDYEYIFK